MSRTPRRDKSMNQSEFIAQQFQKSPLVQKSARQRQTRLYDMKMLETYFKINKPILNKQKRDVIEQTLQLEKQAQKHTKQRLKNDNYFLNYDYNPFAEKQNKRMNRTTSEIKLKSSSSFTNNRMPIKNEMKQKNIIDALRNIKSNNFRRDKEQIMETQLTTVTLSSKINRNAKLLHYDLKPKIQQTNAPIQKEQAQITFQQILTIPEKNFYEQNQGEINIFQFMFGNHRKIMNREILQKYYFSFASNVQKLNKFKIPIHRDLSKLGRTLSIERNVPKNMRLEALNSSQLSFKANDIRFIDLISVASGRINSQMAYSVLFQQNAQRGDNSPNSSNVGSSAISYEQNNKQQRINCNNKQSFRQENIDYLKLQNTQLENRYERKYKKIYENVKINTDEAQRILSFCIKDKKLHKKYNDLVNKDVQYLQMLDNRRQPQTEKYIRTNKRKKDRQQLLKIHTLLSTLEIKNKYHEKIQEIISDKESKKKK